ncbi:MAG: hypothetical protein R6X34_02015 [Chloroflexota bacterium]
MMKSIKHLAVYWLWLLPLLWLAACAPTTQPSATPEPDEITAVATTAPALNPVTPTPENVFTADPTAAKPTPADDQIENQETNGDADSRADVEKEEVAMVYERAGGLKGIGPSDISWTFYADGRVVSSDGRSWQLPPEEITALVDGIMALGFAGFEASYIPQDTCCDRATHTITLYQNGEVYQVSVLDDADAPASLYQAIDLISEFLIALPTT